MALPDGSHERCGPRVGTLQTEAAEEKQLFSPNSLFECSTACDKSLPQASYFAARYHPQEQQHAAIPQDESAVQRHVYRP